MTQQRTATIKLISAMLIFGSIGLFVRYISVASALIALVRAVIGVLFLFGVILLRKKKLSMDAIRKNLLLLAVSGVAIGFNWILLFESYRFTSVAVGTLCYYMAPMIVILLSPLVLKEKLTVRKCFCVLASVFGMALISGIGSGSLDTPGTLQGVLFGLGAAVLYASVIVMNKHITDIGAYDKTITQLFVAGIVLVPYNLWTVEWPTLSLNISGVVLLAFVGIVHTGFAYYLYFGSMEHLTGQSIAIFSYIDPVVAVLASVVLLREPFNLCNLMGSFMIIGSSVVSELPIGKWRQSW